MTDAEVMRAPRNYFQTCIKVHRQGCATWLFLPPERIRGRAPALLDRGVHDPESVGREVRFLKPVLDGVPGTPRKCRDGIDAAEERNDLFQVIQHRTEITELRSGVNRELWRKSFRLNRNREGRMVAA